MHYEVLSPRQALEWICQVRHRPLWAIDLETYGVQHPADALDPRAGRVRLMSLLPFVLSDPWADEHPRIVDLRQGTDMDALALFCALAHLPLVAHNAQFDLGWFLAKGVFPERAYCTAILSRMAVAGRFDKAYALWQRPSLENAVSFFLGQEMDKTEQISDWGTPHLSPEQLQYAAADVAILPELFRKLSQVIGQQRQEDAARLEMRAVPMMAWVAATGMPFDYDLWAVPYGQAISRGETLFRQLRDEYVLDGLLPEMPSPRHKGSRELGQQLLPFANDHRALQVLRSPKQVLALLQKHVHPDVQATDDDTLAELDHPLAELLRNWRECETARVKFGPSFGRESKVKKRKDGSEYVKHVPPPYRRGRIYPSVYQLGAVSGRMTYDHPNLQQIPSPGKHPLGVAYRSAFRAPDGRELVMADFSQIELRLAAQISGDKAMREIYEQGGDIHTWAACRILGVTEPTKHQRAIAKSANFGLLYGAGVNTFQTYARSKFDVRLTEEQAAEIRTGWFQAFPGIKAWHQEMGSRLDRVKKLDTRTLLGRLRQSVDRYSEVLNTPVQGSGADLTKLALARLYNDRANAPTGDWLPVLVVHDEIVLEVPQGAGEAMGQWLKGHMLAAGQDVMRDVPTDAGVGVYKAWVKE